MKTNYQKKKQHMAEICKQRIEELFLQADMMFDESTELSDRYVFLALKLSQKYNVPVPSHLKRSYCKNCKSYLKVGRNCRVRNTNSKMVYFCKVCKSFMRFRIK